MKIQQPDLLSWTPPVPADIKGATFDQERDGKRLNAQCLRVYCVFLDGKKRSLRDISALTGDPEASVSARFRDLKRFGFPMLREYAGSGLWLYWMQVNA